ncbi:MAG: primosomal protein N', partial [Pseudomonadota bacterium]
MFTLRAMVIARILFTLPLPEPFDYEVPDWLRVRPGDYVKAPLGPVERTGVVWEVVDDAARGDRDLKQVIDVYPAPPMPAAMRRFIDWTAKYVVAAPGAVLSMALRHAGGVKPSPKETVFIGTGAEPPKMTDARKRVLEAASELGPASAAELARAADVSAGVVKGLATAGALDALTRAVDQPFPPPNPNLPPMALTDEQTAAADRLKDAVAAGGFQPFLLDGVTGSGKTEVYFEAIA